MGDVKEAALRWDIVRTNKTLDKGTLMKTYASLAKSYDQDIASYGSNRSRYLYEMTRELFPEDKGIRILDAGAGTGFGGQVLCEYGYKNIDALDASPEMLEVAKSKNVYNKYICDYLGPKRLDIKSGTYDLIICIGSLLSTHIKEDAFEEMIRIAKPGGYIVFMVSVRGIGDAKETIEAAMQKLHDEGKWKWEIHREVENYINFPEELGRKGIQYGFRT